MLIVSNKSRLDAHKQLSRDLSAPRVLTQVTLREARAVVDSVTWRHYWQPCLELFDADTRIVHRVNHLKTAWQDALRLPRSRRAQAAYCWRYFGLLHHALQTARERHELAEAIPAIRRIIGFEAFSVKVAGMEGVAAGAVCRRNPIYTLGRLPRAVPYPSPRHIPLALPADGHCPFYHYRQYTFANSKVKLLLFPSADLRRRSASFRCIDRFSRVTANRPDPYVEKRARVLTQRVLDPLVSRLTRQQKAPCHCNHWKLLDLGGGTGHLLGRAWSLLQRGNRRLERTPAAIHTVECAEPCFGRTYGLSGKAEGIQSIQWTTEDYRAILDDERWLREQRRFDVAFMVRLLDNCSFFDLETVVPGTLDLHEPMEAVLPHRALAPARLPEGLEQLQVSTRAQRAIGGQVMPQSSLQEYFKCMRAVCLNEPEMLREQEPVLPIRRFNPGSLVTRSGQSVVAQLRKVCESIVVEDLDLGPKSLRDHMGQFRLTNCAVMQFIHDGFSTEVFHYVITSPEVAADLKGERIW